MLPDALELTLGLIRLFVKVAVAARSVALEVLLTLPSPTIVAVMPDTVPVKVGEASLASKAVSERFVDAIAMFAEPLNDCPAIVRAVCSVVAVPALPVTVV